ncbi:MAG: hypothetical protein AAF368_20765, partial [Planctomycetota bacterium]
MRFMKNILLAAATIAFGAAAWAQSETSDARYTDETIELAARLPMQDAGRIKPLSTTAQYFLLRLRHTKTARDSEGRKREAIEWLLDVLFHPEIAAEEPSFRLDSHELAEALELDV